jgi:hypothetical protein
LPLIRVQGDKSMSNTATELESRVRERAYYLWEQEGRPEGRAEEFWARAAESEAAVHGDHGGRQSGAGEGDQASITPPPRPAAARKGQVSAAYAAITASPAKMLSPSNVSAPKGAKAADGAASSGQAGPRRKLSTTPGGPRRKSRVATEAVT